MTNTNLSHEKHFETLHVVPQRDQDGQSKENYDNNHFSRVALAMDVLLVVDECL